jgi:hypothetical protein
MDRRKSRNKGLPGPVNMHEVSASQAHSVAPVAFEITRPKNSAAPELTHGKPHEDFDARLVDVKIHVGAKARRIPRVLRCELFVQNKTSGQATGRVTVEDTGASVITTPTDMFDDKDHNGVNYDSQDFGHISRIVVTQTDGKIHTVDFNANNGQPLSLTFGPPSR